MAAPLSVGPIHYAAIAGLKGKSTQDKPHASLHPRHTWAGPGKTSVAGKPHRASHPVKDIVTLGDKHRYQRHYGMVFADPGHRKHKDKGHVIADPGVGPGGLPGAGPNPVSGGNTPDLTPVPLPAGLPLMALGLAALVYVRKRMTRN